jgi:cbb3-type cytochrome oxidase maturation protein
MVYLGWIVLVSVSLWVSLLAFVWALRSGQFADQGRARYLPLADEAPLTPVRRPMRLPLEGYALMVIAAIGVAGLLSAVILSLIR